MYLLFEIYVYTKLYCWLHKVNIIDIALFCDFRDGLQIVYTNATWS